ncbi:hypothetical protein [Intestinibacter sp.]|uniref:hypothetical protein n=1 Tax=Intestinibacter sp. TaxID=1965304 RepID=UPI003F17EBA9
MITSKKKILIFTAIFILFFPVIVFANTQADIGSIDGAKELVNLFNIWVKGAGALVLMIGCADMFLSMASEHEENKQRALKSICAGFLLITSYPLLCAICDIANYDAFETLLSVVALFLKFIGAMTALRGSYMFMMSLKDQSGEARDKSIKLIGGGLATIVVAQSCFSFLF